MIINKNVSLFLLSFCFYHISSLHAQKVPELIADRPHQTASAVVVPTDALQIETGFIFQKQKFSDGSTTFENDNLTLGTTLIRYGVSSNFELRFGGEYFAGQTLVNGVKSDIKGMQNLLFGGKLNLRRDEKILSNAAIIIQSIIPFGSEKLRPNNFIPTLLFSADQTISENVSFGFNIGVEKDLDNGRNSCIYSGSLSYSLSDELGSFFEFYGNAMNELNPSNNLDLGLTYLFKKNLQVDVSAGTTLLKGQKDYFGSFGVSLRLPK